MAASLQVLANLIPTKHFTDILGPDTDAVSVWELEPNKVQGLLGARRKEGTWTSLISQEPSPDHKAMLLSRASGPSQAWLAARRPLRLTNADFITALSLTVGVDTVESCVGAPRICNKDAALVTSDGLHALNCTGLRYGRHGSVHTQVKDVVREHIGRHLRPHGYRVATSEFQMSQHFDPIGAHATESRGDFAILYGGEVRAVVDVKSVNPACKTNLSKGAASTQGAAAQATYNDCVRDYTTKWSIDKKQIVPFVVEIGGYIHPDSYAWLRATMALGCMRPGIDSKGKDTMVLDKQHLAKVMRDLVIHVQTVVQRTNASTIHAFNKYVSRMAPAPPSQLAPTVPVASAQTGETVALA
jgi:hypothetical protein